MNLPLCFTTHAHTIPNPSRHDNGWRRGVAQLFASTGSLELAQVCDRVVCSTMVVSARPLRRPISQPIPCWKSWTLASRLCPLIERNLQARWRRRRPRQARGLTSSNGEHMAELISLREAVSSLIHDGDTVAMEGFTHLIPFAAGHEVIRQRRRNLTLVRMTPDVIYDQLIGAGCASRLIFSWGGNPGVGSLHRLRDAVEHGWPQLLAIEEHSHAGLASAYVAGASNLPFATLRGYAGSDLPKYNDHIRFIRCPFTGEELAAVKSVRPDVSVIHAQKADRKGNVLLWGILGVQKEAALAARRSIVTVEEIVDDLGAWPNATVLPSWAVTAVCEVSGGARPSYAQGYYERDNRFYQTWDTISRSRERFQSWIQRHVLDTADFAEYARTLRETAGTEQA